MVHSAPDQGLDGRRRNLATARHVALQQTRNISIRAEYDRRARSDHSRARDRYAVNHTRRITALEVVLLNEIPGNILI